MSIKYKCVGGAIEVKIVSVSEIAKQVRGISYKPHQKFDLPNGNTVPLVRANNISDFKLDLSEVYHVDKSLVKNHQLLRKGDILVAASSGSKDIVGKPAFVENDLREPLKTPFR